MIDLKLYAENGQPLGNFNGDYFKFAGIFRLDDNTPLRSDGRAFIDYPAVFNKDGKRYKRERLFCVSYDSSDDSIINPITITPTQEGVLVYRAFSLHKAKHTPANVYYGYINEIALG